MPHVRHEHYLEIDPEYLDPVRDSAVPIEVDPGDIVLFHNLLVHCGLPNRSDKTRWSMDWRYQDATEATNRDTNGHLARSTAHPDQVVSNAATWAELSFC